MAPGVIAPLLTPRSRNNTRRSFQRDPSTAEKTFFRNIGDVLHILLDNRLGQARFVSWKHKRWHVMTTSTNLLP
jgi:hypothetical protein